MTITKNIILALAMATGVFSASCSAVGYLNANAVPGPGGLASVSGGITIIRDGVEVGSYNPCRRCKPVCSNTSRRFIGISSELPLIVAWGADCQPGAFTRCVVNYGDQIGVEGEVGNDSFFYGLGIATQSTCEVKFDC